MITPSYLFSSLTRLNGSWKPWSNMSWDEVFLSNQVSFKVIISNPPSSAWIISSLLFMLWTLRWAIDIVFSIIKSSEVGMLSTESSGYTVVCSNGPGFTSISPHSNSVIKIHSKYKEVNVHINTVGYVVIECLRYLKYLSYAG